MPTSDNQTNQTATLPLTDARAYTGPMTCATVLTDPEATPEEIEAASVAMYVNGWDFLVYDLHLNAEAVSLAASNYTGINPLFDN